MPKQTNKKKVVSSNSKRKISTPVGILIAVSIGLVLAVVGTFGYTQYKGRDLEAKAAQWKEIQPWRQYNGGSDGVKFVGCRNYMVNGPDSQQGKPVEVNILASKPKSLGPAKQSGFNDVARLYPGVFVKKPYTKAGWPQTYTWNEDGGRIGSYWWNDELTQAIHSPSKTSDKLAPYVISEDGNVSIADNNELFENKYNTKYVSPPIPSQYEKFKDYKKALKQWQRKTISVAKLPNCN